jgi:hypothetical protein
MANSIESKLSLRPTIQDRNNDILAHHVKFTHDLFASPPQGFFGTEMLLFDRLKQKIYSRYHEKFQDVLETVYRVDDTLYDISQAAETNIRAVVLDIEILRRQGFQTTSPDFLNAEQKASNVYNTYEKYIIRGFSTCMDSIRQYIDSLVSERNPLEAALYGGLAGMDARLESFDRNLSHFQEKIEDLSLLRADKLFGSQMLRTRR